MSYPLDSERLLDMLDFLASGDRSHMGCDYNEGRQAALRQVRVYVTTLDPAFDWRVVVAEVAAS